jgi:hypothetical protein
MNGDKKRVGARKLVARDLINYFGVVDRTITRWVETGILPQPIYINHRRYWDEDAIAEAERTLRNAAA